MSNRSIGLSDQLYDYLLEHSPREPDVLRRLREETARLFPDQKRMQIAPEQGAFLQLLVRLVGAEQALEVGVFTGYSALSVAMALPKDGRLVGCDVSAEYTQVAERYFEEAGLRRRLHLRLGPAVETLDRLLEEGAAGTFDVAFLDADKMEYDAYYERALRLLRPGGLCAVDNVFRGGRVAEPPAEVSASVRAVQQFNAKLRDDARVRFAMLPVADGLTLALKRQSGER